MRAEAGRREWGAVLFVTAVIISAENSGLTESSIVAKHGCGEKPINGIVPTAFITVGIVRKQQN